MAGERALPGLGLRAFWTPGSNGWNAQLDPDLRKLSVLVQAAVISRSTNLPASPDDGVAYIVPVGQANANQIAARDNGAWVYLTPQEGFLVHVNDADVFVKWTGSAWQELATGGGPVTPSGRTFTGSSDTALISDANNIIVGNSASAQTGTIPPNSSVAFPVWTTLTYVQAGVGALSLVGGSGVTVHPAPGFIGTAKGQYSMLSALQISANTWVVTGHLEVAP